MKVLFIFALLAVTIISPCLSALSRRTFRNPSYPGKCYVSENLILSPGEKGNHPRILCAEIRCHENGSAVVASCGFNTNEQSEQLNLKEEYPKCCEKKTKI